MDPDQARLLPRYRLERQQARALTANLRPGRTIPTPTYSPDAGGDPHQLRGIPVVGARGIGGASPGTQPESEVCRER